MSDIPCKSGTNPKSTMDQVHSRKRSHSKSEHSGIYQGVNGSVSPPKPYVIEAGTRKVTKCVLQFLIQRSRWFIVLNFRLHDNRETRVPQAEIQDTNPGGDHAQGWSKMDNNNPDDDAKSSDTEAGTAMLLSLLDYHNLVRDHNQLKEDFRMLEEERDRLIEQNVSQQDKLWRTYAKIRKTESTITFLGRKLIGLVDYDDEGSDSDF